MAAAMVLTVCNIFRAISTPESFRPLAETGKLLGEQLPRPSPSSNPKCSSGDTANRTAAGGWKIPARAKPGGLSLAREFLSETLVVGACSRGGRPRILARLRFDVDILNLLPPDEPTVQGLKLYQQHFTNARELVVTLRAPDAERPSGWRRAGGPLAAADQSRRRSDLAAAVDGTIRIQMANCSAGCGSINRPRFCRADQPARARPAQAVLDETKEVLATSMSPMDVARRAFDPFDLLNHAGADQLSGFSMEQGKQMFASAEGNFRWCSCNPPWTWAVTARVRAG
jgi:hypothetical protein